jgi:xanthine dehydrogenase accessory factor
MGSVERYRGEAVGHFERAAELRATGVPFVVATVTWRRGPASGQPGSRAIIFADGTVEGWLGGACARPTVVAAALDALTDGEARLLALGDHDHRPDVQNVPMACSSDGAMEVFVEPQLPAPHLHLIGSSPMIETLAALARDLDWRVSVVDEPVVDGAGPDSWIVIGTQGHYDDPALEAALRTPARYVGLVASRKRSDEVLNSIRETFSEDQIARVRAPAGLDLGHTSHTEIAVAILAEIVSLKSIEYPAVEVKQMKEAIDPVCQMTVDIDTARFKTEYEGRTYYFCAAGCLRTFEENPERFVA